MRKRRCSHAYRVSGCPNIAPFIFLINIIDPARKIMVAHSSDINTADIQVAFLFTKVQRGKRLEKCSQDVWAHINGLSSIYAPAYVTEKCSRHHVLVKSSTFCFLD